jgi:hypothetical protein
MREIDTGWIGDGGSGCIDDGLVGGIQGDGGSGC